MKEDVYNHLAVSGGNVIAKVVEKYGVRKIGEVTEPRNRKIVRGAIAVLGMSAGLASATGRLRQIPAPICYGLTALGSYNAVEVALGPENILGITGKMFPEELEVTMPDITRLRSKIGAMAGELQRAQAENAKLRAKVGMMFPEETIRLSPSSTAAHKIEPAELGIGAANSAEIMEGLGTVM